MLSYTVYSVEDDGEDTLVEEGVIDLVTNPSGITTLVEDYPSYNGFYIIWELLEDE